MQSIQANQQDFANLYEQYVKKIFNFIYYKTHHKETAEDLTSETFMKALKKINDFDEKKGKFSTWIYQIARNTVIDFYRAKKNLLNIEDIWDLTDDENIPRDFDVSQKLKEVKNYLKKLSSYQREVVLLRIWEGMSYKEIAEALGRDEVNCRVIFSRTIGALKKEIPFAVFLAMLLFRR